MKKVKFNGKLSLNKETIAKLNDSQMKSVNGGATVNTLCGQITCGCSGTMLTNTPTLPPDCCA